MSRGFFDSILVFYFEEKDVCRMPDISLQGKTVVLGVTGGIAAYKIPNVAHALAKLGADVHVLMTKNATEFIAPLDRKSVV